MRALLRSVLLVACVALAAPASAAPVFTQASLTVDIAPGAPRISVFGSGLVDVVGSTVMVPAGLVSLGYNILLPVTGTTAINTLFLSRLSNLAGTFSVGGVAAKAPGEVCPGGPALGEACHLGGRVGGTMGLTGTFHLVLFPDVVPRINLYDVRFGRGGGSTNVPFSVDAAAWSSGTGVVGLPAGTFARAGGGTPLQLVAPAYAQLGSYSFPMIATLTLTAVSLPVPEASAALLVGCVGLALVLWRRR